MAPNVSKIAQNGSTWLKMALNRFNWVQINSKGSNLLQMAPNESKWPHIGSKWFQIDPNGTKFVKTNQDQLRPTKTKTNQDQPRPTKTNQDQD